MTQDRSQHRRQRSDGVEEPAGGVHDAPTTLPTPLTSPTPVASRDLLFARLALVNAFIDQETLDNALDRQKNDPSQSLAEILVQKGTLAEEERRLIEHLCERNVAKHGDDPEKSLSSLSVSPTVPYGHQLSADTGIFAPKPSADKQQGTFGDYELLEEIARGGMGVVYKARQTRLNRLVALKMIRSGELADSEQVRRFYAEAEAAAKLDHVGIVPVYEVGQTNGRHFFSMAYIAGKNLNDSVKSGGPLLPQQTARLMKAVAEAVQFAHGNGIVHRDIKPQNILLDERDQPRVTDFGLAKQVETPSELTATGQIMGTPSYMPPEQAMGEIQNIGPMSDVYSLGATLYFLLTGRPPFQTASTAETIRQVIEVEPVPVRRLNPAIPHDLETICLKCLRKEPVKRYATAADLAADLGRWLEHKPIVARPVGRGERVWLWCKRRPAVAALSGAVVIILVVGSMVALERQNAVRAHGLVERLLGAPMQVVPSIVAELAPYGHWSDSELRKVLAPESNANADRRLRAAVGLLAVDPSQAGRIYEALLVAPPDQARVLIGVLDAHKAVWVEPLWRVLADPQASDKSRLRAAMALATYEPLVKSTTGPPNSEQWVNNAGFIVREFLTEARQEPSQYEPLTEALAPLASVLLAPLGDVFRDHQHNATERDLATSILARYAANSPASLADLVIDADGEQFLKLFPILEKQGDAAARETLRRLVCSRPSANLPPIERVALGQRRAGAAIALLKQGDRDIIFDALRGDSGGGLRGEDPESLTQFVDRCRARGVTSAELLECVKRADALRQIKNGPQRRVEDGVLFGLLLALGEFDLEELPEVQRDIFVEQLANWHGSDPSSAIHSVTGWLLRHWNQEELAKTVDQTPVPYTPGSEWFTLQIKVKTQGQSGLPGGEQSLYITFVVFPAGEHLIGSPTDEIDRRVFERLHRVKLTRPLAVSDREITWEQYNPFDSCSYHDGFEKQLSRQVPLEGPVFGVNWFEAVSYCRWLTGQAQLAESDQCYAAPEMLAKDPEGNPRQWPVDLDRRGFRLPTEAEWEMVCRSGTNTAYSLGNDSQLLRHYGWFSENSDNEKWSHAVGLLRPNPRGLFDIHGNVFEWCHDWYGEYVNEGASDDPTGPAEGSQRVHRGGGWNDVAGRCRAANRLSYPPTGRAPILGFRVAVVPFSQTSESAKGGPNEAGSER